MFAAGASLEARKDDLRALHTALNGEIYRPAGGLLNAPKDEGKSAGSCPLDAPAVAAPSKQLTIRKGD